MPFNPNGNRSLTSGGRGPVLVILQGAEFQQPVPVAALRASGATPAVLARIAARRFRGIFRRRLSGLLSS